VNAEMNFLITFKSGIYSFTERQEGGIALRAVRYGVRTLVETRGIIFSLPFPTVPGAGPAFSTIDPDYRGVALITHPCLAPRLRMSGAIPMLPLYASYGVLWGYQLSEC